MRGSLSSRFGRAILLSGALLGGAAGCAPSTAPSPSERPASEAVMRSNYIVALAHDGVMPDTPERAAQVRASLDADRDRILQAVFGADAPSPGGSFVSAYAFEIRLTPEEAVMLARHSDVVQVQADQVSRPTNAGRKFGGAKS